MTRVVASAMSRELGVKSDILILTLKAAPLRGADDWFTQKSGLVACARIAARSIYGASCSVAARSWSAELLEEAAAQQSTARLPEGGRVQLQVERNAHGIIASP
jgi:hypothetical protein